MKKKKDSMEKINLIIVFFRRRHGLEDLEFRSKLALSYMWFSEIIDALSVLQYNLFVKKLIGE